MLRNAGVMHTHSQCKMLAKKFPVEFYATYVDKQSNERDTILFLDQKGVEIAEDKVQGPISLQLMATSPLDKGIKVLKPSYVLAKDGLYYITDIQEPITKEHCIEARPDKLRELWTELSSDKKAEPADGKLEDISADKLKFILSTTDQNPDQVKTVIKVDQVEVVRNVPLLSPDYPYFPSFSSILGHNRSNPHAIQHAVKWIETQINAAKEVGVQIGLYLEANYGETNTPNITFINEIIKLIQEKQYKDSIAFISIATTTLAAREKAEDAIKEAFGQAILADINKKIQEAPKQRSKSGPAAQGKQGMGKVDIARTHSLGDNKQVAGGDLLLITQGLGITAEDLKQQHGEQKKPGLVIATNIPSPTYSSPAGQSQISGTSISSGNDLSSGASGQSSGNSEGSIDAKTPGHTSPPARLGTNASPPVQVDVSHLIDLSTPTGAPAGEPTADATASDPGLSSGSVGLKKTSTGS